MIRTACFLFHVFHLDSNVLAKEVLEKERRLELSGLWSEGLHVFRHLDNPLNALSDLNKEQDQW